MISGQVDVQKWRIAIIEDDGLSSTEKHLLLTLSTHFQPKDFCHQSASNIANQMGMSKGTVRQKLKHLDNSGWIVRNQWKSGTNYIIQPDSPPDTTPDDPRNQMTDSLRQKVLKRDYWTCQNCGATPQDSWDDPPKLEVDHIVPVSKGGMSHLDNLQVLCRECNLEKCDETPDTCEGEQ
jgi:DNA-binding Lrp family transcriptional regulator